MQTLHAVPSLSVYFRQMAGIPMRRGRGHRQDATTDTNEVKGDNRGYRPTKGRFGKPGQQSNNIGFQ